MPKKPYDADEEPPGGRAAERLREFERARGISPDETDQLDPDDQDSAGVMPEPQASESVDDTSEED